MSFNFPNAPNPGDVYQPVGGPSYSWDGQKWVMTGSPLQVTPAYAQRNRIVNGAMQISQENGNTAGTGTSYYMADQWYVGVVSTGAIGGYRVASVTPRGSRYRLRITVTTVDTSLAAGEYLQITQKLEGIRIADFGWGAPGAKQAIVRFGFRGPAGTYTFRWGNGVVDRSYLKNFTISAAQANIDTEQVFIIPGDTTGTWQTDNSLASYVGVGLAGGTTFQGVDGVWQGGSPFVTAATSNGLATLSNYELFDVGLYLDATGSGIPPAWEMSDEAAELAACKRYWQLIVVALFQQVTTGFNYNAYSTIPVPIRATPTLTGANQSNASFPATAVSIVPSGPTPGVSVAETRLCNATSSNGAFLDHVTVNARM